MLERLSQLKYLISFLILVETLLLLTLHIQEDIDKELFLKNKTQLAQIEYETVYRKTKEQSEMIFHENINTKEIKDIFKDAYLANDIEKIKIREQLQKKLHKSYSWLKKSINLKQLHFHLPNNHSFLRMHKPDIFGDDLSKIRPTVAYVTQNKEAIDGFEEGRIYNGFRFVYPLFYQEDTTEEARYIGSVEVSFSALSFQKTLSNDVRLSQFIFSKKIIEEKVWEPKDTSKYIQAPIHPMFMIEHNSIQDEYKHLKVDIMQNMPKELQENFKGQLHQHISFSQHIQTKNKEYILSFLPLKNPVTKVLVGYLVIIKPSSYLSRLEFKNDLFRLLSFAFLLSLFLIIYLYRKHYYEIQVQKILLMEQSKMAQMGSMLSNIAHQWKQPLAQINAKLIEIPLLVSLSEKDSKELNAYLDTIEDITSYMGDTIENFRTYFHPNKQKISCNIFDTLEKSIVLAALPDTIQTKIISHKTTTILSYENELIQVLITLLTNAKEALLMANTQEPYINIYVEDNVNNVEILIVDNAGGIEVKTRKQIFNPYFSTKDNNINSGIGLYMAKMIIEGMRGTLDYKQVGEESHFLIRLDRLKDE